MGLFEQIDLISAAALAALALIAVVLAFGVNWLKAKTGSELLARILRGITTAARIAVQEVWVTYVKALKEASADGTLTDDEKLEARARAIALVKSFLGAKGIALLLRETGIESSLVDKYLGAFIEQALAEEKRTERITRPLAAGVAFASDPSTASATA